MAIHDITRPLHNGLHPWPGDTPFDFHQTWKMADGAAVNVGAFTSSTHNGTHADAPFHFLAAGAHIDEIDPAVYIGPALVFDLSHAGSTITRDHLAPAAAILRRASIPRLLLKTDTWPAGAPFPIEIPLLAPGVPAWLGELGIRLVGLDLPSVDAIDSRELPIHHALAAAGLNILESLDLAGVTTGIYELIALPLRILGGDAAPVRAVLLQPD